jgi:ADP-ribose pyrophosphatase
MIMKDGGLMDFFEHTLERNEVFQGKIITLETQMVEVQDGNTAYREIVRHPGGVCILARDENDKILLVRQYRKPMEEAYLELPAGKLEKNLTPYENAVKELEEETGYRCDDLIHLATLATSPGFCDEKIHLYMAKKLEKGIKGGDDDEFISLVRLSDAEFIEHIKTGQIKDAKTVAAYSLSKII